MVGRPHYRAPVAGIRMRSVLRCSFAAGLIVLAACSSTDARRAPTPPTLLENLSFLRGLTRDVVEAARVIPGVAVGNSPTNVTGGTLVMPGGRGGYPAFWIRDLAMSLDSGFVSPDEALHHLRLVGRCQNGPDQRPLKHGLVIPAYAIPDHINFDGTAVFYPGTYSSGEDQGDGTYGQLPPVDDHYEFIHIAWWLWRTTGNTSFLNERIGDFTILGRLLAAFGAPEIDAATGLVQTSGSRRAVGFGFCDAIHLEGKLLFASLLRYRAAGELSQMLRAQGKREQARALDEQRRLISRGIPRVFGNKSASKGWLLAATQVGTQPDVWGTLYALHLGVLKGSEEKRALEVLRPLFGKEPLLTRGPYVMYLKTSTPRPNPPGSAPPALL